MLGLFSRFFRKYERTNQLNGHTYDRGLSPLALEQGILVNKDRSLGYGFRIDAAYTPSLSDEAVQGIYTALGGFLNALPEHFDLQVIWTRHARTAEFEAATSKHPFSPGLVGEVQQEQQQNLLGLLREGHLRWIEVYILLVRKLPMTDAAIRQGAAKSTKPNLIELVTRFFTNAREAFVYDQEQLNAASAELRTHSRTLAGILKHLGWDPRALTNDDVIRLFFQRWNPRQFEMGALPAGFRPSSGVPLTERFVHSAFRWDPAGRSLPAGIAELDGWYHAILTLYEPPEEMSRPLFDNLLLKSGLFQIEVVVNVSAAIGYSA